LNKLDTKLKLLDWKLEELIKALPFIDLGEDINEILEGIEYKIIECRKILKE